MNNIPSSLHQAYEDVLSSCPEALKLPTNPNEFRIEEHFNALDRACFHDLKRLGQAVKGIDFDHDEDPDSTAFLASCIRDAKRLQMWNLSAFAAAVCSD